MHTSHMENVAEMTHWRRQRSYDLHWTPDNCRPTYDYKLCEGWLFAWNVYLYLIWCRQRHPLSCIIDNRLTSVCNRHVACTCVQLWEESFMYTNTPCTLPFVVYCTWNLHANTPVSCTTRLLWFCNRVLSPPMMPQAVKHYHEEDCVDLQPWKECVVHECGYSHLSSPIQLVIGPIQVRSPSHLLSVLLTYCSVPLPSHTYCINSRLKAHGKRQ